MGKRGKRGAGGGAGVRNRSHPKDFAFRSNPITRKPLPTTLVFFCLAMCWTMPRDRLRLQMLQLREPDARIITVSENKHTLGKMEHFECDFRTSRGQNALAHKVKKVCQCEPESNIFVFLDYYWTPCRYLEIRYGLSSWLKTDLWPLLEAGVEQVIFPNDDGTAQHGNSMMKVAFAQGGVNRLLDANFIAHQGNPLWMASSNHEIQQALTEYHGGDNTYQSGTYLHPTFPFVSFTKNRCSWQELFDILMKTCVHFLSAEIAGYVLHKPSTIQAVFACGPCLSVN